MNKIQLLKYFDCLIMLLWFPNEHNNHSDFVPLSSVKNVFDYVQLLTLGTLAMWVHNTNIWDMVFRHFGQKQGIP